MLNEASSLGPLLRRAARGVPLNFFRIAAGIVGGIVDGKWTVLPVLDGGPFATSSV